jgi:hypothetical protein
MKKILIALFMCLPLSVFAQTNTTTSTATSTATAGSPTNTITVTGGGGGLSLADAALAGKRPAESAASINLSVSNLTCGGTSGISGQGASFGFGLGGSYEFEHCVMIQDAITLQALGHPAAAHARMCASKANRVAFAMVGDDACKNYDKNADLGDGNRKPAVRDGSGNVVHSVK